MYKVVVFLLLWMEQFLSQFIVDTDRDVLFVEEPSEFLRDT